MDWSHPKDAGLLNKKTYSLFEYKECSNVRMTQKHTKEVFDEEGKGIRTAMKLSKNLAIRQRPMVTVRNNGSKKYYLPIPITFYYHKT